MRLARLLLAGAAITGSVALSAPAEAQPCIPYNDVAFVCVVPDTDFRGVVGGFYQAGPLGAAGIFLVAEGCYYPGGQPQYYVYVYTDYTPTVFQHVPVSGIPCV